MMTLTRDKLESVIDNIKVMLDYPWHHKLNFILENDQAQRAVIARYREKVDEQAVDIVDHIDEKHKLSKQIEQQAKEITRLQEVTTAWRNIQQEEMCYVMREIEALGIDINKSVISDGKALWDVCMERIAELRKAEQENTTLREALQSLLTGKCGELLAERAPYSYKQAQHALKEVS